MSGLFEEDARPSWKRTRGEPVPGSLVNPPDIELQKKKNGVGAHDIEDPNRSQPFSDEAEKGLLSCFLQNPAVLLPQAAGSGMMLEQFYHPANRLLYGIMREFSEAGKPVELVSLSHHLLDNDLMAKIGGPQVLAELLSFVPTPAHFPYYTKILRTKWIMRRVMAMGHAAIALCHEFHDPTGDPMELLDKADEDLLALRLDLEKGSEGSGPVSVKEVLYEVLDEVEHAMNNKGKILGTSLGIPDLDRCTNGLEPPDVFVIGARPGMGKTNLLLRFWEHLTLMLAEAGVPTAVFSLEMSRKQMVRRALFSAAGIAQSKARTGMLSRQDKKAMMDTQLIMMKAEGWIDDTGELNISEIRARVRQLKRKHKIKGVLIDYAQIIDAITKKGLSEERLGIAEVFKGLKAMAKECRVWVIVLAQANRESEKNPGHKPKMSDFDGSAAIEKWADYGAFIHRPSKYKSWDKISDKEQDFHRAGIKDTGLTPEQREEAAQRAYEEVAELLLVKSRNSGEAKIDLRFIGPLARFEPRTQKLYSNNVEERQHGAGETASNMGDLED